MPTRIILHKPNTNSRRLPDTVARGVSPPQFRVPGLVSHHRRSAAANNTSLHSQHSRSNSFTRRPLNFRASVLRELSVRSPDDANDENDASNALQLLATLPVTSDDDIRASPRLMGYLFILTAAAVMLVSVIQFYRESIIDEETNSSSSSFDFPGQTSDDPLGYYTTASGQRLVRWKVWAVLYLSAAHCTAALGSFLVHFDGTCCPTVWVTIFRDGSVYERNWILFLLFGWAATLHVATSVLSVGEYQANVYFTTWIGFGATALTYGVWRESAGVASLLDQLTQKSNRETSYNWMWTGIFSAIFAGSCTDIYINRNVVELRFRGEQLELDASHWTIVLAVIWTEVAACAICVALNEIFVTSWQFPCRIRRRTGNYRFVFGWRKVEGLLILVSTGLKYWAILEYTGVDGVINGLSNAYFGIWGSFFNSVFALGTWLRENENVEWIVREREVGTSSDQECPPDQVQFSPSESSFAGDYED